MTKIMRKESKSSFKPFSMRSAPILVWGIKVLEKTPSKGLRRRKSVQKNVGQEKKNSEGFLCVDSQEEIEIHYGRGNNQGKMTKTNEENLILLRYHLIQ